MSLAELQQQTLQDCMQQWGCPLCRAIWMLDATRFSWFDAVQWFGGSETRSFLLPFPTGPPHTSRNTLHR
ncbi:MAG TPA: hypothetical protein VEL31_19145 [Ktedonobacteraceae bacterium]|nr:hypothetical protein [Ktedonobacteraceae bacterium]